MDNIIYEETYMSDNSEYEYESDDNHNDSFSSDNSNSIDEFTNSDDNLNSFIIPDGMKQYAWVNWCLKMKKLCELECSYDIHNTPMRIDFTHNDISFYLSVEYMNNELNELEYPFAPPMIHWNGSKIIIDEYLKITNNIMLDKNNWNVCTDLNVFVYETLAIIKKSTPVETFDEVDSAICSLVQLLGMKFAIGTSDLPKFGVKTNGNKLSNYLSKGERIIITQSTQERLGPHIDIIVRNIELISIQTNRAELIKIIITDLDESKPSKLEICSNEGFYNQIVSIANIIDCEDKCKFILSQLNKINSFDKRSNDKVLFVDALTNHTYSDKHNETLSSKFVKRVMSEIELIKDALRDIEGYVAISESSIQLMKIMLIPDYDTPYGGGYFEFDIFVSGDYPNSPPLVKFLTTGNGRVRFNPNLYRSGKVCLSILNTWAQNQWNPTTSSLSQVILSVFTMIFIEHPYTNEPAYYKALSTESGRALSEDYNSKIRNQTVRVAISSQLNNRNSVFRNIIQQHWQKNKQTAIEHYAKYNINI